LLDRRARVVAFPDILLVQVPDDSPPDPQCSDKHERAGDVLEHEKSARRNAAVPAGHTVGE
jgi:hypothetical protein